jgi:hypothetical protein
MKPKMKRAARVGPEAARDTATTGEAKYSAIGVHPQGTYSALIGVTSFDDLLRKSTPRELYVRVRLHQKYLPDVALPENLQRALGAAWRQQ